MTIDTDPDELRLSVGGRVVEVDGQEAGADGRRRERKERACRPELESNRTVLFKEGNGIEHNGQPSNGRIREKGLSQRLHVFAVIGGLRWERRLKTVGMLA